jgi:hypothetical protein
MRLTSAGNLGIGTAAPGKPLDVVSDTNAQAVRVRGRSSDSEGAIQFTDNTASTQTAAISVLPGTSSPLMRFLIGSTERMRIDNAGLITGAGTSLGAWTAWTPTWTGLTIGNATVDAKYCQIGKIIHWRMKVTFGSTTSWSGNFQFTVPVAPHAGVSGHDVGQGHGMDSSVGDTTQMFAQFTGTGSTCAINRATVVGSNVDFLAVSNTTPWTWAQNDYIYLNGTYEAA